MRWLLLPSVLAVALPSLSYAQEVPAISLTGARVVVPKARGRKTYGGTALTRSLRRTMTEGVGPLISSRKLRDAQRRLQLQGKQRWSRANLARAGQQIGADYVLYTQITRRGWLYTARARLVNTLTQEVQMDFRSQYYDPAKEAADRGGRIGRRTLLKMQTLAEEGRLLLSGTTTTPSPPLVPLARTDDRSDDPPDLVRPPDRPADDGADDLKTDSGLVFPPAFDAAERRAPSDAPTLSPGGDPPPTAPREPTPTPNDRRSEAAPATPPPPAVTGSMSAPLAPTSPAADSSPAFETGAAPPPSIGAQAPIASPGRAQKTEIIRLDVAGGAGLLRRYDVSSSNVADSGLSYPLDPTSLIRAGAELILPGVELGLEVDFAFRPVQYEVGPVGAEPDEPGGMIINTATWVTYHVRLAGEGRNAFRLIPKVGARFDIAPVDEHDANFIVSSTAISVVGGLGMRWPVNRVLEIGAAFDGGWVASYSEDPGTSGDSSGGFTLGGELELRFWLTSAIGIALDTRYRYTQVDFDGVPSRPVPNAEVGQLENVSVTTQDLLTSLGLALRF